MTLNPGQLNPNQGFNPYQGATPYQGFYGASAQGGQSAGLGGSVLSAYGNSGQNFGQGYGPQQYGSQQHNPQQYGQQQFGQQGYAGLNVPAHALNTIEDIADDIAERVADEIADQAATGASALYQSQDPHSAGQSVGGLNIKRWLNAARITDGVRESVKQNAHQLARQAVAHLLNVIQAQWPSAGQHGQQGQQFGQQFGQLGGLHAPGLAAYGAGGPQQYGQQQNIAQLAPVVAAILGILQTQGQGLGQNNPYGAQGRQI